MSPLYAIQETERKTLQLSFAPIIHLQPSVNSADTGENAELRAKSFILTTHQICIIVWHMY